MYAVRSTAVPFGLGPPRRHHRVTHELGSTIREEVPRARGGVGEEVAEVLLVVRGDAHVDDLGALLGR